MSYQTKLSTENFLAAISASLYLLLAAAPVAISQQELPVLKVESNLVLVRVVARDSQGKPIAGLKKEDFKLYDRGKEQLIAQFDEIPAAVAMTASRPSDPHSSPGQNSTHTIATPTSPARFVAFYFDDLNAPQATLMQSRDAADKFITTNLQPTDKVAIFTSDKLLTDFTSDAAQIHRALAQIDGSSHAKQSIRLCPDISEYQAQQILRSDDYSHDPSWQLAGDEIRQCSATPTLTAEQIQQIKVMAHELLNKKQAEARANLEQVEQITRNMANFPGQRTILLISPGFLSEEEQYRLDSVIEYALHGQVVINALDPEGLAILMRDQDASRRPIANTERAINSANTLDRQRAFVSGDVLTELTQGTGGILFHNDNDLAAGFASLAGHPDEYTLAFSPKDFKHDGKFHNLKVTLANRPRGATISARKGYFANEENRAESPQSQTAVIKSVPPATPPHSASTPAPAAPQTQQIDDSLSQAILANNDSTDLPIQVDLKQSATEVSLLIHLDARALPFRKDGDQSIDTVTFAAAVFDRSDKVVVIKQRSAKLNVTPTQLASLIANGIELTFTFPIESDAHRIRAVVTESEQHKVGSLSKVLGALGAN